MERFARIKVVFTALSVTTLLYLLAGASCSKKEAMLGGLVLGAGAVAAIGAAAGSSAAATSSWTAGQGAAVGAVVGGAGGAVIGSAVGEDED